MQALNKHVFMLGALREMVTFFFLREFIQLPTRLLQHQSCIIPKYATREHQYKGIRTMKNDRENYYVGCNSCCIKQSVSHSFRAVWVRSQQSCFITWQDKDYKAFRKQSEMGEPFLSYLGTISVPSENLF